MTRPLTFKEYEEIRAMESRVRELYGQTRDAEIGGILDAFDDNFPHLQEQFEPQPDPRDDDYETHIRRETAAWRFV